MRSSWLLALSVSLLPSLAAADAKSDAKAHMAKAAAAHKEGRYADAKTELEAAYALDPQPQLLYGLGQVHVKLGKCAEAISYYEKFLATNPDPTAGDAATQAINTCKVALDVAAANQSAQPTTTAAPEPAPMPPPPPPRAEGRPLYKDPVALALIGGGVVALGASGFLYASARGELDDAETAATYEASQELVDSAHGKRTLSIVFAVAGVGLVGGGVVLGLHRASASERRMVSVVPAQGGGLVTFGGSF